MSEVKTLCLMGVFVLLSSCASREVKVQSNLKASGQVDQKLEGTSKQRQTFLLGKWHGEVVTNSSDPSGGGNPSLGETGTELEIYLFPSEKGIEGELTIGQAQENWLFTDKTYVWLDDKISVQTQEIAPSSLPLWMKKRLLTFKYDQLRIYRFEACKRLKDSKACEVKKDLSEGIANQGHWIFMRSGTDVFMNVYYTYPSGGQRILEQRLSKR